MLVESMVVKIMISTDRVAMGNIYTTWIGEWVANSKCLPQNQAHQQNVPVVNKLGRAEESKRKK